MSYGEDYYKGGNYTEYLDRRERYHRLARDVDTLLDMICLKDLHANILDFGCGVGFLVEGFRKLGYVHVWGHDTSQWAIDYANSIGISSVGNNLESFIFCQQYLTTMLDVLEHMTLIDIDATFNKLESKYILVRIPVTDEVNGEFVLQSARMDETHVTAMTKKGWTDLMSQYNYREMFRINLPNIWDSEGVLCAMYERV